MTLSQFAILSFLLVLVVGITVEVSIRVRWASIDRMFARALMHGGSIDGAVRDALKAASEARANSDLALASTAELKVIVDGHTREIRKIREHPLLRPPGGEYVIE